MGSSVAVSALGSGPGSWAVIQEHGFREAAPGRPIAWPGIASLTAKTTGAGSRERGPTASCSPASLRGRCLAPARSCGTLRPCNSISWGGKNLLVRRNGLRTPCRPSWLSMSSSRPLPRVGGCPLCWALWDGGGPTALGLRPDSEQGPGAEAEPTVEEAGGRELGKSISDFTQFYEDPETGTVELQTAIVTYWKKGPWWDILRPEVQVDLVSVVHIGDPEYYEGLQEELLTYDRVLYEMVAERSQKAELQGKSDRERLQEGRRKQHRTVGSQRRARGARLAHAGTRGEAEEYLHTVEGVGDPEEGRKDALQRKRVERGSRALVTGRVAKKSPKSPPPRRRTSSIVGFIQRLMARTLRLSFQLDHINYQTPGFRNADLDYETFCELQRERQESIFSIAKEVSVKSTTAVMATVSALSRDPSRSDFGPFRRVLLWASRSVPMPLLGLLLIDSVCYPPGSSTGIASQPAVKALLNLDVASALKVFLAQQMASDVLDTAAEVMEQSVIVGDRNKVAMEELHKALEDGCRRVAIFYGSAHLPDLHKRLKSELGMEPVDVQWRTAWSILGTRSAPASWQGDIPTEFGPAAAESLALKRDEGRMRMRGARLEGEEEGSVLAKWPLTRYQTGALLLLSLVLAVDLWLWEVVLRSIEEGSVQVIVFIANLLDKGWGLPTL